MLTEIDLRNRERRDEGKEPIKVSVRIHCGTVVQGNIGSARRLEYAVLGDTINVANRLEEFIRPLGVQMATSDDPVMVVRDEPGKEAETLLSDLDNGGPQPVCGRKELIVVWTL